jgi:hypothetical protein
MSPEQSNLLRVHLPQHWQHYFRHQSEALAMNVRHAIFKRVPTFAINEESTGWTSSPCAVGHRPGYRHRKVCAVVRFRSRHDRVARLAAEIANTLHLQFSHFIPPLPIGSALRSPRSGAYFTLLLFKTRLTTLLGILSTR